MGNYIVTTTAQTLDTIMGADFDDTKSYIIHVNDNTPSVLAIIPSEYESGTTTVKPYDGSRGIERPSFSDYEIGKNGATTYLKSTNSDIDIYIAEKEEV